MNTIPDADLVVRLRNGDISAGGVLYERYKRNVYYFALKMLRDDAAAQDIVQQTFVAMIEKIGGLRQHVTFQHWLFTIARNEALMVLRHKRLVPMDGLEDAEGSVFDADTPETVFARSEASSIVYDAVDHLRPDLREVILLRLTERLTYEEIASITHSTVTAVRAKLYYARTALSDRLSHVFTKEDQQ